MTIRLSQNLWSGIFVTSKNAMCQKGKFSWHKGSVLSVNILNGRIVYTGLSPPTPPLILYWSFQGSVTIAGNSNCIVRLFVPFPTGVWDRMWNSIVSVPNH